MSMPLQYATTGTQTPEVVEALRAHPDYRAADDAVTGVRKRIDQLTAEQSDIESRLADIDPSEIEHRIEHAERHLTTLRRRQKKALPSAQSTPKDTLVAEPMGKRAVRFVMRTLGGGEPVTTTKFDDQVRAAEEKLQALSERLWDAQRDHDALDSIQGLRDRLLAIPDELQRARASLEKHQAARDSFYPAAAAVAREILDAQLTAAQSAYDEACDKLAAEREKADDRLRPFRQRCQQAGEALDYFRHILHSL